MTVYNCVKISLFKVAYYSYFKVKLTHFKNPTL